MFPLTTIHYTTLHYTYALTNSKFSFAGIFHVIRAFEDDAVVHVDDSVDPIRDLETIQHELCLKDLQGLQQAVDRAKEAIRKEKGIARAGEVPLGESFVSAWNKCVKLLEDKTFIASGDFTNLEVDIIKHQFGGSLITTKPVIYIINLSKKDFIRKRNKWLGPIGTWVKEHGGGMCIPMSVEFEEELYALRDLPDQAKQFLDEATAEAEALGLKGPNFVAKSGLPKIIKQGYKQLNLINFLTAGEKEVRAWTGERASERANERK